MTALALPLALLLALLLAPALADAHPGHGTPAGHADADALTGAAVAGLIAAADAARKARKARKAR